MSKDRGVALLLALGLFVVLPPFLANCDGISSGRKDGDELLVTEFYPGGNRTEKGQPEYWINTQGLWTPLPDNPNLADYPSYNPQAVNDWASNLFGVGNPTQSAATSSRSAAPIP